MKILVLMINDSGVILEKVCEYLYYNETHKDSKDVPDMEIPPELCLELLMAADFLNGESFRHTTYNNHN
jgi:elongin-C